MRERGDKKKPSTTKRMIIMLIVVGVLLAGLIGFNVFKGIMIKKYMAGMSAPPQTVTAMKVSYQEWQPSLHAVGTLRAVRGADLALDASGVVTDVDFASGDEVTKGQPLVSLRDDEDAAQLHQDEAAAALARVTFERARRQLDVKAISKADYDSAAADLKARQAAVAQQKAVIAKKNLRAPFDGRTGIVTLSPGAYVNAGTPIVTLQQLDPIYVDFYVPQKHLGEIKPGQATTLGVDAFGDKQFEGTINAINPKVDGDTRNVQVEATVPNPEESLTPGMFARVSIDVGGKKRYLTLPQTAITFNPYGQTVFLAVKASALKNQKTQPATAAKKPAPGDAKSAPKDGKSANQLFAQQVFVTTGPTRGDQVAVLSGIKEGDQVVTSGQVKLKNGTPLIIDNSVKPANNPHPTPQEH
ncbi:MAG TPA: efflux RND transporter periplasmic adaptor subunit [Rhodanobacteraceae bacterium]|nr:efflux RND transporter periplasmic adaptor subunit [Rhodanobacteraceae bacterium]